MSSFGDEDEDRIGFTINNWDIKNEFNPNRIPRKRRNDKKSGIFGSFGGSDSSEDEEVLQQTIDKMTPFEKKGVINFVPSVQKDLIKQENEELEEEKVEINQNFSESKRNRYFDKTKRENIQHFAGMRRQGNNNIVTNEDFGGWESYTKGIGAKLLQKMGYEQGKGLGKNLQGITAPIEAKQRSGFGAIGYLDPRQTSVNIDKEFEENAKTRRKIKALESERKQNTKRAKKVIKTADQIITENLMKPWNENDVKNVKVIDMTGPQQRILSGYHQINQMANEGIVESLMEMTEQEITENTKELKREALRFNGLEEEIERIKEVIEEENKRFNTIENIFNKIENLSKKFNENELSIDQLLELYDNIRIENPMEFEFLKLHEILIPTAFPLIRKILSDWKPLEDCDSIKQLFVKLKQKTSANDDSIYEMILWEIWMPVLRHNIYDMPSIRQCDELINFLDSWRLLLPDWLFDNIIEQLILPLLQKEVEEWNPLTDTVPIHSWLHPWLPLMADRSLEHLYDPIRHKLSNALTNWHPSDESAKLILQPWKGVFSVGAMEAFLNINIVPKLELTLQSFLINPHQQCLDVWHWVMSWHDLLSTPIMASILEKSFFPKWLNVLYNWLSNEPNYNEVNKWYIGWKTMLSPQLLSYPSIADMLSRALQMMEHSVHSKGQMKPFHSYQGSVRPSTQIPSNSLFSVKEPTIPENSFNFKELVEHRAGEKGILFMPITHRFHESKQIYKLGKLITYIDNKVLFVFKDNNWIPTSLQLAIDSAV